MASDFDKLFGDDWRPRENGDEDSSSSPSHDASKNEPSTPHPPSPVDYTSETENRTRRALNEREVKVIGVYMQQEEGATAQHFVLLRDNKTRRVPIWVGQFEAYAISIALEGDDPPRPLTHDLAKIFLEKLGASVERVVIDDLWNETFYARIVLQRTDGGTMEVDCRPSDAIALAVRAHAPIYMAESVLEQTVADK